MRAKISYTVDIKDVPAEVNKLLQPALDILSSTSSTVVSLNKDNVMTVINQIEEIRKTLLDVDTRLSDCYSILAGYTTAITDSLAKREINESTES